MFVDAAGSGDESARAPRLGLDVRAGLLPNTGVWPEGKDHATEAVLGTRAAGEEVRRDDEHQPVTVKGVALSQPAIPGARSRGEKELKQAHLIAFSGACAVRIAHRDYARSRCGRGVVAVEWPKEKGTNEDFLSTLPKDITQVGWSITRR